MCGTQIAAQLQHDEQKKVDRPIQLGPPRKTVAPPPPTERELKRARQVFGSIILDTDTSPTPSPVRRTAVPPMGEDDDLALGSALLASQISKQVASEAEKDHERATRE